MTDTNSSNGALTRREQQVLSLTRCGSSTREIAEQLGITPTAVNKLRTSAGRKLGTLPPRARDDGGVTPREREILGLLAAGHSSAEIAHELGIAPSTVKTHLTNAYKTIGAKNRVHAVRYYLDHLAPPAG